MHGGMSVYRGAPAAARRYLEAERSRADDYYLTEGTGIADRYVASPTEGVRPAGGMSGDAYEAWVAGYDPVTVASYWVDTPGPCSGNLATFPYRRLRRPIYPLDAIAEPVFAYS